MRWIFGYGSLMWQAGFDCSVKRPGVLYGWHRQYGLISTRNRGTKDNPGMVLTLAPGGTVKGLALGYEPAREAEVLKYLDDREGVNRAHKRVTVPIWHTDGADPAWSPCQTYLPILSYENYRGGMALEHQAELIAKGVGTIGSAFDYLRLLLIECGKLGVAEPALERLLAAAQDQRTAAAG